jgi:hypothetical protein
MALHVQLHIRASPLSCAAAKLPVTNNTQDSATTTARVYVAAAGGTAAVVHSNIVLTNLDQSALL